MAAAGDSTRVIIIAFFANMGIALAKFVGAFVSGSASMFAEAIHSVVDSTNQLLLLVGNKKSKRPPTEMHPLGHGREAFFWSFIVAILLFSLGGMFAIYEGVHKLQDHEPLTNPLVPISILVVAILLESYSFYACWKEVKAQNTYGSLWTWLRKTTAAELLVVFTEDTAALIGLVLALISTVITWLTGDPTWDAMGSIAIGVILIVVAIFLAIEIKSLIVGEASSLDFRGYLERRTAELIPGGRVLRVIALQIGAGEVMLSYKVSPGQMSDVKMLIDAINHLERDMKAKFPELKWQFAEPDFEA